MFGLTVIEFPKPAAVPPQLPVYQCQLAPVPNEPPTTVSVVEMPLQIVVTPETEVGSVESVFTVTNCDAQVVAAVHGKGPSART